MASSSNMTRSTAVDAPAPPEYQIQETPLAFFSTRGGRCSARKIDHENLPPPIVRTNERADMDKMIKNLRAKWPHQCFGIFARSSQGHPQWHLPWFFDEYDAAVHGARFLYDLVLKMQKQNEIAATTFIGDWGASNENKWHEINFDQLSWDLAFADTDKQWYGEEFLKICFRQIKAKWDGAKENMRRQAPVEFLKHKVALQHAPEGFNSQLNAAMPPFDPSAMYNMPYDPRLVTGAIPRQQVALVTVNGGPFVQSYDGHVAAREPVCPERQSQRGGRGSRGKPRGGRRLSSSGEHDQSSRYPGSSSSIGNHRDSFGRRQSISDAPPAAHALARKRTESLTGKSQGVAAAEQANLRPEDFRIDFKSVGKGINYLKVLNLGFIPPSVTQRDMCVSLEEAGLRVNWVAIHPAKDDASGNPFGSAELYSTKDVRKGLAMKTIRCSDTELTLSIGKRFMRSGHEGPEYEIPEHWPPSKSYYPRSYSPQDVRSSHDSPEQSRRGSFTPQDVVRPSSPAKPVQRGRVESNAASGLEAIVEEIGQGKKDAVEGSTKRNDVRDDPPHGPPMAVVNEDTSRTEIEPTKDTNRTDTHAAATASLAMKQKIEIAPQKPAAPEDPVRRKSADHTGNTKGTAEGLHSAQIQKPPSPGKKAMKLDVNLGQSEEAAQGSQSTGSSVPLVANLSVLGITTSLSRSAEEPPTTLGTEQPATEDISSCKHRVHEAPSSKTAVGKDTSIPAKVNTGIGASSSPKSAGSPKAVVTPKPKKSESTPTKPKAIKSEQESVEWVTITPKNGAQASIHTVKSPSNPPFAPRAAASTPAPDSPRPALPASAAPTLELSDTNKPHITITPTDSPPSTPASMSQSTMPLLSPWKAECDKIAKTLGGLAERQSRDSAFSLRNFREGFEKIDKDYEDSFAKTQGGSKTVKKNSKQKLKKACDKQKELLDDLHLLRVQVENMVGTGLTMNELVEKRQEKKPKSTPRPEQETASAYPKLNARHARLDSEGASVRGQRSSPPSSSTSAHQQAKASQWPFLNMFSGTPAQINSLLSAPSQRYAVDEHGIDSRISFDPLAQSIMSGREAWERNNSAPASSATNYNNDPPIQQGSDHTAPLEQIEREAQDENAFACGDVRSPTVVGPDSTIDDVQSNNEKEIEPGAEAGQPSASQPQPPQETQCGARDNETSPSQPQPPSDPQPSMRGGAVEAARAPRPSYASAARSSSRPIVPALPKGVAKHAGEEKRTKMSGEWRVGEGQDWSKSGGFKKSS